MVSVLRPFHNSLLWQYIKDGSGSSGSDCGWVDYLQNAGWQPPPVPEALSQAMDTDLAFSPDSDGSWFSQSATYYCDNDAAESKNIDHSEEVWMESIGLGAGTISFYWKVSSEEGYDYLGGLRGSALETSLSHQWLMAIPGYDCLVF